MRGADGGVWVLYISIFVVGVHLRRSSTKLGHSCIATLRDGIFPCKKIRTTTNHTDHQPHRPQRHETRKEKWTRSDSISILRQHTCEIAFTLFFPSIFIERALHAILKTIFISRQPPHRSIPINTIAWARRGRFSNKKTLAARVYNSLHFTSLKPLFSITVFFFSSSIC